MATEADRSLSTVKYIREKSRWTYKMYATLQAANNAIIESLVEHGYCGIDAGTKVMLHLDGITTDKLNAVKTTILSSPVLGTDLHGYVGLYKDFIKHNASFQEKRNSVNISQVDQGGGDDKETETDEFIQDRYYSNEEYRVLRKSGKKTLWDRCQQRDSKNSKRGCEVYHQGGGRFKQNKTMKAMERLIQLLTQKVADSEARNGRSDYEDEAYEELHMNNGGNRNHAALTRQ